MLIFAFTTHNQLCFWSIYVVAKGGSPLILLAPHPAKTCLLFSDFSSRVANKTSSLILRAWFVLCFCLLKVLAVFTFHF